MFRPRTTLVETQSWFNFYSSLLDISERKCCEEIRFQFQPVRHSSNPRGPGATESLGRNHDRIFYFFHCHPSENRIKFYYLDDVLYTSQRNSIYNEPPNHRRRYNRRERNIQQKKKKKRKALAFYRNGFISRKEK